MRRPATSRRSRRDKIKKAGIFPAFFIPSEEIVRDPAYAGHILIVRVAISRSSLRLAPLAARTDMPSITVMR